MNWNEIRDLDPSDVIVLGLKALGLSILFYFVFHFLSLRLPSASHIDPLSLKEPEQSPITSAEVFKKQIAGHEYSLLPKANYLIRGLVVERQDSSSWMNITHGQAGDFLNTHDLCVIWGSNAVMPDLRDVNFSHGDWTCYYQTSSQKAWMQFRKDQISNNHILPESEAVHDVIRSARIGDQIEIQGWLVDYSTDGGPYRRTSLVRDDTDNGACEIIYAQQARILSQHSFGFRFLEKLALSGGVAGLLALLLGMFVLPFLKPQVSENQSE